jgi:hypothetical protein
MSQEPHRQDRHGLRLTDHSSVARFVNLVFYQSINPPLFLSFLYVVMEKRTGEHLQRRQPWTCPS